MKAKELLQRTIEERRKLMEQQCTQQIIHHYEVTCPDCGLYYGGHATGCDDICTCVKHDAKKCEFSNWQFEWKLEDFWIGAFWKRTGSTVDLWICFLPCLPLHISWGWKHSNQ